MIEYGINCLGPGAQIFEPVTLGFPSRDKMQKTGFTGTTIGKNSVIRSGTIIYCDVITGDFFQTGHNVVIREETRIGDRVSIGTATVIDGHTTIGNDVNLQSRVYLPTNTRIGNHVWCICRLPCTPTDWIGHKSAKVLHATAGEKPKFHMYIRGKPQHAGRIHQC